MLQAAIAAAGVGALAALVSGIVLLVRMSRPGGGCGPGRMLAYGVASAASLGIALVLMAATAGGVVYALMPEPIEPVVRPEIPEERLARTHAPFTSQPAGAATVDPATQAELEAFMQRFASAARAKQTAKLARLVDGERMFGAIKAEWVGELPTAIEEWQMARALPEQLAGALTGPHGHIGWERVRVRRIVPLAEGDEAVLYVGHTDARGTWLRLRWWVARGPAGWRAYDYDELEAGMPASAVMAPIMAAAYRGGGTFAWHDDVQRLTQATTQLVQGEPGHAEATLASVDADSLPRLSRSKYYMVAAMIDLSHERYQETLDATERMLALHPDASFGASLLRARAMIGLGRHEEALGILQSLIEEAGEDPAVRREMGGALEALGRPEEALEAYDRGLAEAPGDYELLLAWAPLLPAERKGEIADQVAQLLHPSQFEGVADALVDAGDEPGLLAAVEGQRRRAPDDLWIPYYDAVVLYWNGDGAAAAAILAEHLDRADAVGQAHHFEWLRMQALAKAGRAVQGLREARDRDLAFRALVDELFYREDYAALGEVVEAYAAGPHDPLLLEQNRGEWLLATGRYAGAADAFAAAAGHADPGAVAELEERRREALFHDGRWREAYTTTPPDGRGYAFRQLAALLDRARDAEGLRGLVALHAEANDHPGELAWWRLQAADLDDDRERVVELIGEHREAILAADPTRILSLESLAVRSLCALGRFDEALDEAQRSTERDGDPYFLIVVHAQRRDAAAAEPHVKRCLELGYDWEEFADDPAVAPALEEPSFIAMRERVLAGANAGE